MVNARFYDKNLYVDTTDLPRNRRFSFLSEDIIAAGTTLRVQSIVGFESLTTSSGQVLLIGNLGDEKSEIRRTTNASADGYPSETYKEIGLRDALKFDHPQDTKVFIIDYDRLEVNWAATVNGTKATVAAYPFNITPDVPQMVYLDKSATAGFFFARFNRTIDSVNSDWSDAIPYAGYDDNMVFSIKKRAIDSLGEEIDGKVITHEFLNESLWEARREYHNAPGKRPFRRKFNTDIGNALTGSFRIELPTDVNSPFTAENIYGVRIGANANMRYYDKKEWDFDFMNKPHSTLEVPYTRGTSTSIWLANGRDFSSSPTISVEGMNIACTRITGEQNSFTITTHGSYPSASGGSDAWENPTYGLPSRFTVFAEPEGSAYIYFNRVIETAYIAQNIYADYYRTLVGYNSDSDTLDEPEYDFYVNYLMAKIKHRRSRGTLDITTDSDYKVWLFKKQLSLNNERLLTDIRLEPSIEHLIIPE